MDHQHIRDIIHREIKGMWDARNPHISRETSHGHRVTHTTTFGDIVGHAGHTDVLTQFHNAFTETHSRIDHLVVEGDHAAYRVLHRAKHTGEFLGIAPTGREVAVYMFNIARFEGEHIAEQWSLWDGLGLLQQLGAMPPLAVGRTAGPKKAAE